MKLQLENPIAFFDLETTGVNVATDRIVEYSIIKRNPDGTEEVITERLNPTVPIPLGASQVHGIYDKDVSMCPTFAQIASKLNDFLENCDLAGYNSNKFDVPLLVEEFLRAGVEFNMNGRRLVDVQNIFHKMEQRTLAAAYKFYCKKELVDAHSAEADNRATAEILEAQLERYQELENNVDFLQEFSSRGKNVDFMGRVIYDEHGIEVFNFGKHKGKAVEEVLRKDPGYFGWILQGEFPLYTKKVLKEIKERAGA